MSGFGEGLLTAREFIRSEISLFVLLEAAKKSMLGCVITLNSLLLYDHEIPLMI